MLTRGGRILEPGQTDLAEIWRACAEASVVVGVEGSQLSVPLLALRPGARLLILQPPQQVNGVFKGIADAMGVRVAMVVAEDEGDGAFRIPDLDELDGLL